MNDMDLFYLEKEQCPWDEMALIEQARAEQQAPDRTYYMCGAGHIWVKAAGKFLNPQILPG